MSFLGSLVSGAASLFGGILGSKSAKEQQQQNIAQQRAFAQSGVQWRVEDAKKAGVHPLYALGANTSSFAPVSIGDPLGQGVANMGQDIGNAIDRASSAPDRQMRRVVERLTVERLGLQNDLLRSQIARSVQQSNPAIPMSTDRMVVDGQGDSREPLFTHDPKVAMVTPPGQNVETIKLFGLPLQRNPRLFSSGQAAQDEYGEPAEWAVGVPALLHALYRALRARGEHISGPLFRELRARERR